MFVACSREGSTHAIRARSRELHHVGGRSSDGSAPALARQGVAVVVSVATYGASVRWAALAAAVGKQVARLTCDLEVFPRGEDQRPG